MYFYRIEIPQLAASEVKQKTYNHNTILVQGMQWSNNSLGTWVFPSHHTQLHQEKMLLSIAYFPKDINTMEQTDYQHP